MKIIGLTGFAKSGKSTAAEILKSMGGQEVAFAKHLKDVCSIVFNVPRDHFDDQAFKEVPFLREGDLIPSPFLNRKMVPSINATNIIDILKFFEVPDRFVPQTIMAHVGVKLTSPRHIAQYVGTEILRSIDTDIHINMALKLNQNSNAKFLICSDVRFDNELRSVNALEGIVLGISRKAATPENIETLHPSEREIPDLIARSNSVVLNEYTIESFQEEIKRKVLSYLEQNKK